MASRFLDTNVFLRYFTRDDPDKAEKAFGLLARIEAGEETVETALPIIFETVYTLNRFYRVERETVRELLRPILQMRAFILR